MERTELAELMLQWHGGQNDPVYAVGSFYCSDERYPDLEVFDSAVSNLESDLSQQERMLAGEKVKTYKTDDLKTFAGWSDEELIKNVDQLGIILVELQKYRKCDYVGCVGS